VDCLDRTNTAQFVVGKVALGFQLYALGSTGLYILYIYIYIFFFSLTESNINNKCFGSGSRSAFDGHPDAEDFERTKIKGKRSHEFRLYFHKKLGLPVTCFFYK
jgi:hypothetical protein